MKKIFCISMILMFPFLSLETNANPIGKFKPWEKEQTEKQATSQSKDAEGQQSQQQPAQEQRERE